MLFFSFLHDTGIYSLKLNTKIFFFFFTESDEDFGLFSVSTFQACLVPKLLQMFCVRDSPIRLILLTHLNSFIRTFQMDDLKHKILPELLVGIKDTDDYLVSTTLRALADLVPILGAATVIGGNRGRLFTDGRPKKLKKSKKNYHVTFSTPSKSVDTLDIPIASEVELASFDLPERPSPDGDEDRTEVAVNHNVEEIWDDWDTHESEPKSNNDHTKNEEASDTIVIEEDTSRVTPLALSKPPERIYPKKPIIADISELDIKNSKPMNKSAEEIDFFTDMEPVIKKTQVLTVAETAPIRSDIFKVKVTDNENDVSTGDGWADDDFGDWDVDDNH